MNIITYKINKKNYLFFLLSFVLILSVSSCSHKIAFATSSVVPAAEGTVKIKKDKNKNYSIDMEIEHLADPSRLQPPKNDYVIWIKTESNGIKNLGQLRSSSGFFSSTRKASIKTVTSFKPTEVFITAEDKVNIPYPTGQVVLTTNNF